VGLELAPDAVKAAQAYLEEQQVPPEAAARITYAAGDFFQHETQYDVGWVVGSTLCVRASLPLLIMAQVQVLSCSPASTLTAAPHAQLLKNSPTIALPQVRLHLPLRTAPQ